MARNKKENKYYTLITGATGGLGRAYVSEFARLKHNLVLTGTTTAKLEALKSEILSVDKNLNIITFACDLSKVEDRCLLLGYLESQDIIVDYLVNNAGFITEGSIAKASVETLLKCIAVNCEGTIHLTKALLDRRDKDAGLNILTVTSLAANYPMPYMAIYSATKALLKNFFLSLREEYKHAGVKSLIVLPGAIPTSNDMKEAIKAQGVKGRLSSVSPEKIAKKSIKLLFKNKKTFIPGFFNKLTAFASLITPLCMQVRVAGSMWKKSQNKRGIE